MASPWLLLRSDTAAWGKSGLPEVLGVILGLSWRGILAQIRSSGKEAPTNTTQHALNLWDLGMVGFGHFPLSMPQAIPTSFSKCYPFM